MKFRILLTVPHLFYVWGRSFHVVWAEGPSQQAIDAKALRYIVTSAEVNKQIHIHVDR